MKELTNEEYRRCCVLVEQYKSIMALRSGNLEERYLKENLEYIRLNGKNPPFPDKTETVNSEESFHHSIPKSKRRKNYGITPRLLGYITIDMAIKNLGYGRDFEAFLRRTRLGSKNLDAHNYGKNANYERLQKLFKHLLSVGFTQ